MNYPTERILGTSLEKSGAWERKILPFWVFPKDNVPLRFATRNTPFGNTARYAPSKHFIRKGKIPTFDRYGEEKTFFSFCDRHQKFGISFCFTYLFRFVITSCELFFAFRHLISELTLTRAILWSVHMYLTRFTAKTQPEDRWHSLRTDVFSFPSALQVVPLLAAGGSSRSNIVRCSC